jgi:hypothetical protein
LFSSLSLPTFDSNLTSTWMSIFRCLKRIGGKNSRPRLTDFVVIAAAILPFYFSSKNATQHFQKPEGCIQ